MFQKLLIPAVVAGVVLSLAACSGGDANTRRLDYKRAVVEKPLEVPPDLTPPQGGGNDMQLPLLSAQGNGSVGGGSGVLPPQTDIHVAGSGALRWLVVDSAPEVLWAKLKPFWATLGLTLQRDEAALGIMETDWAENRADIKGGALQRMFTKVLPGLHSASTRDRYRLRLERAEGGKSELYVTHYGVQQVVKSTDSDGFSETIWQVRPSDAELSNEVLKQLMVYLGTPEEVASALAVTENVGVNVRLVDEAGPALRLDEGFDRAWRRAGIALDRMGLVVEDRDRSNGLYYVSKVELLEEEKKAGWFSGLFSGKKAVEQSPHYRVKIDAQGDGSLVTLQDGTGQRLTSESARGVLERMLGQMQ